MIGKRLGHYQILEKLGAGGMGEVYLANDEHLPRSVAIKVLPPGTIGDQTARKLFRREALALCKLSHPNIETVHDFDTEGDIDFLVMEYVQGKTLSEVIAAGPLPEGETIALGMQLAEGLTALHEKGVIHRDLKPANLRITPEGRLKILDFGLAKLVHPVSDGGVTMSSTDNLNTAGTLPYMAPEQLRGQSTDTRSDIHAAGALLYEMATGQRAFPEALSPLLIDAILNRPPVSPRTLNDRISQGLERIALRCLEKNPELRYQSAGELRADLRQLSDAPFASPAPIANERKTIRHFALVSSVVALLSVAVTLMFWMTHQKPTLAFSGRDWILIADFENLTGEPLFDKSLDTALKVSIEQSSYVNVFPRRRITETLRRMKKENTDRINAATGREVAEREGIKVLLVPSITGVGGKYVLSASLEDSKTGSSLRSEMTRAEKKQDILPELDRLAALIRRDLGESALTISRQSKPLVKVTTSSLEALKQYSMGFEQHRSGKFGEARTYYENALAIDPDFASAKASLGMIHYEAARLQATSGISRFQGIDGALGKKLLGEAAGQADKLTDRERLGIQAFHARAVDDDLLKAIQFLKSSAALYPDDVAVHNNLGWFCRQVGRIDEAISEYKEAIRVDPSLMLAYDGLNGIYLYLRGSISDAVALCKTQLAQNDSHWQAYANLGWAYLGKGEPGQAQVALETALRLNPKATLELFRLAHAYRLQKNYPKALETLKRIPALDPSESVHYDLGVIYQLMNDREAARRHFDLKRLEAERAVRANPKDFTDQITLATVRGRLGLSTNIRWADRRDNPPDSDECFLLANYYAVEGKPDQAIEQLELAISKGWNNYIWMRIHPDHETLAREPRFQALLEKVLR